MARRAPPVPPPWGAQGVWGHPGTLRGAGLWQELPPSQGHCDLLWHRDGNWVRAQESALQDGPEAKGNLFCVLSSLLCLSRQGRGAGCCLAFFDVVLALILIRERVPKNKLLENFSKMHADSFPLSLWCFVPP